MIWSVRLSLWGVRISFVCPYIRLVKSLECFSSFFKLEVWGSQVSGTTREHQKITSDVFSMSNHHPDLIYMSFTIRSERTLYRVFTQSFSSLTISLLK